MCECISIKTTASNVRPWHIVWRCTWILHFTTALCHAAGTVSTLSLKTKRLFMLFNIRIVSSLHFPPDDSSIHLWAQSGSDQSRSIRDEKYTLVLMSPDGLSVAMTSASFFRSRKNERVCLNHEASFSSAFYFLRAVVRSVNACVCVRPCVVWVFVFMLNERCGHAALCLSFLLDIQSKNILAYIYIYICIKRAYFSTPMLKGF